MWFKLVFSLLCDLSTKFSTNFVLFFTLNVLTNNLPLLKQGNIRDHLSIHLPVSAFAFLISYWFNPIWNGSQELEKRTKEKNRHRIKRINKTYSMDDACFSFFFCEEKKKLIAMSTCMKNISTGRDILNRLGFFFFFPSAGFYFIFFFLSFYQWLNSLHMFNFFFFFFQWGDLQY